MRRAIEQFLVDTAQVFDYLADKILTVCEWLVDSVVRSWKDPMAKMILVWFVLLVLILLGN